MDTDDNYAIGPKLPAYGGDVEKNDTEMPVMRS